MTPFPKSSATSFFLIHTTDGMNKSDMRKASKHEDGADLISNLPDHILLLILSGLPSTEEIIRTSILSRRWRYLWTSIPSLDLVYPRERKPSGKSNYSKFKEFVDWVLLNRSADLDSFRVSHSLYYSMSTIERWIHAAVMRNVKQLDLVFPSNWKSEDMAMPVCASLEVLRVIQRINGDSVKDFLESCPMLEDLTLDNCRLDKLDRLTPIRRCETSTSVAVFTLHVVYRRRCETSVAVSFVLTREAVARSGIWKEEIAGRFQDRAIKVPEVSRGAYHALAAFSGYMQLGDTHSMLGQLDRSIECYKEGLKIQMEALGDTDPRVAEMDEQTLYFLLDFCCETSTGCIDGARHPALPILKSLELTTTDVCSAFRVQKLVQILKHCPELESLCWTVQKCCYIWSTALPINGSVKDPDLDFGKCEVAETTSVLTPDVKWVEFFEISGEKPKLDFFFF
ncbi:hypothetical protein LXL04_003232 [Taraxacum kok-saghyz]